MLSRLNGEFAGVALLKAIRWETEFYQAYSTFQAQIPRSTDCDLVIGILRWRLGTELPPDFKEKLPDDKPFPSGTAYEILTAIEKRQRGAQLPDVYVFRFAGSSPSVVVDDPNRERVEHDWQALKSFFQEWFVTERGHFKAAFNQYTSEDDLDAQLEELLRKWVADKVAGGRVVRWPVQVKGSPFCGLSAFGAKHAPVFFGRSRDTARAVDLWRETGSRGSPFLLVVGASGSGKSSLARAGVLPRLTTPGVVKDVNAWRAAIVRPGDSPAGPFAALAAALMRDEAGLPKEEEGRGPALPEIAEGDSKTAAELAAVLRHADATALQPILNALSRVAGKEHNREHYSREVRCDLVLLIDQMEELFASSVGEIERTAFIALVAAMVQTGRIWVTATLRADFYARMLNQPALKALKEQGATYDLAPPGPVELAEIVRAPAEAAGLVYETEAAGGERLDERLLRDADRPDMLPLVQLALSRLFEGRKTAGDQIVLPLQVYENLGGLKGIVNDAGERALAALGETEKACLPRLLRQLAVPAQDQAGGSKGALTIRAVPLERAAPDEPARKLVDALVTARLLTTSGVQADAQVRLTHQRVLEDWTRARTIVVESADFYRIRADLEESRRKWEAGKRRSELLLPRGLPLAEAVSIVGKYGDELTPELRADVRASRARAQRVQVIGWAAAAVFALVAAAAVVTERQSVNAERQALAAQKEAESQRQSAVDSQHEAENQRQLAETQRNQALTAQSEFLARDADAVVTDGNVTLGMLLALDALPVDLGHAARPFVPSAEAALENAYANLRERAVLYGHHGPVTSAMFSPDGTQVLTTSADNTSRIWDAASGATTAVLDQPALGGFRSGGRIVLTAFESTAKLWDAKTGKVLVTFASNSAIAEGYLSPDGRRLLTAGKNGDEVKLWDAATGQPIAELTGQGLAGFSSDGSRVLTQDGSDGHLWDGSTGTQVAVLKGDDSRIVSAAFSPDSKLVATGSYEHTTRVWNAQTGAAGPVLGGHVGAVSNLYFSPDSARVLGISDWNDPTAQLWDARSGQTIAVLQHDGVIKSIAFSPDGSRILTASDDDHSARVWDAKTGIPISLMGGLTTVNSAAFSPDGASVVTASDDHAVRLWDVNTGASLAVMKDGDKPVNTAAFSPDGARIVSGSADATVRVWNVASPLASALQGGGFHGANVVAFAPTSLRFLAASSDGIVQIWDAADGAQFARLQAHQAPINAAAFSTDGTKLVTASDDKTARIWDVSGAKLIVELKGHEDEVTGAAFSPDGLRVMTSDGKTVRIWDARTGSTLAVLPAAKGLFVPDGSRVITFDNTGSAQIWNATTWKSVAAIQMSGGAAHVAASPDGTRVAMTADLDDDHHGFKILDVSTADDVAQVSGHDKAINSIAFSPDGTRIVTASDDKTVRLWDAKTAAPIRTFSGFPGAVNFAGFLERSNRIVTASDDGVVRLWDSDTGVQLVAFKGHPDSIKLAALSPDGSRVVTGSSTLIRLWRAPLRCQELIDAARKQAPRSLSTAERSQYFIAQATEGPTATTADGRADCK